MERVGNYSMFEVLWATASAGASRVYGVLQAYSEARGRAAAQRELEHLSDHMLRDIGLRRSDFRS